MRARKCACATASTSSPLVSPTTGSGTRPGVVTPAKQRFQPAHQRVLMGAVQRISRLERHHAPPTFFGQQLLAPRAARARICRAAGCFGCGSVRIDRRVGRSGTQNTPLAGKVQIAGSPVAGAKVTLYAAGTGAPAKLAEGQTDGDGAFRLDGGQAPQGSVLYLVAKGGTPKAAGAKGPNDAIALLAVPGNKVAERRSRSTNSPPWPRRSPPRASSTGKRSPGIRSDCGSPPETRRILWIPRPASGARRYLTRSTAP